MAEVYTCKKIKAKSIGIYSKVCVDESRLDFGPRNTVLLRNFKAVAEVEEIRSRKNRNNDYIYKFIFTASSSVNTKMGMLDEIDPEQEFIVLVEKVKT